MKRVLWYNEGNELSDRALEHIAQLLLVNQQQLDAAKHLIRVLECKIRDADGTETLHGNDRFRLVEDEKVARAKCEASGVKRGRLSGFYFCLIDGPHENFDIVSKLFWNENQCLDDRHLSNELSLPDCFVEIEESIFECTGGNGRGILLALGMEENNNMQP